MEGEQGGTTVSVTGASGLIGSWLVMKLLERGYFVRAIVRNPANMSKVKHLLDLPKAGSHLSLWKADLTEEGSYDDAIQGCAGVFHVASPMEFLSVKDPENEMIKPTINGVLNIMRSCSKAKTVKRLIYTSTTGTVAFPPPPQPAHHDESIWTDVEFCRTQKMTGWAYFVAKTIAEKAAWEFAKENGIDFVTILPSIVLGPFLTTTRPPSADMSLALLIRNEKIYPMLARARAVHLEDVCNAHIYLFEHPQAQGRYICSSHCDTIFDIAKSLSQRYPDYNVPTKFEGVDETLKPIPASSKKLMDLGFKFKYNSDEYDMGDLFSETIEFCREKGLMPL